MSDYDETDRSEDEEEDERVEDGHKSRLTAAQAWIIHAVEERKRTPVEGTTKKAKLTEEDVDQFFEEFSDLTHDGNDNTPTLLHVIVDLVSSTVGATIDSATVKALVQRLVQQSTRLLCIRNDEQQNPLYLAILKKKKVLADYMVASCPQDDGQTRQLARALEDYRGNEKRKNCLHLAFEKDLKPSTLLRMVKTASITALEAVDTTGKRPMHYAVQYNHCIIEVIRAFLERDDEARKSQIQPSGNQPLKTFLDVDEKAKTSVYQEHVSSVEALNIERGLKRGIPDQKIKKAEPTTTRDDDRAKLAWDEMNETVRGRSQVTKSKPEHQFELKSENKNVALPDELHSAASRNLKHPQDQAAKLRNRDRERRIDDDGTLKELELRRERLRRQEAEARKEELGERSAIQDVSKDRQSLGPAGGRNPLRVQTALVSAAVAPSISDIAANTPKPLRRVPTTREDIAGGKFEMGVKPTTTVTKKSRKPVDHEAAARDSRIVLRMLKLHYMRTRSIEKATWWLYKTNPQDVQTFFDYHKLPSELKEDLFEKAFRATKFDEVLKFVHFTNVTVIRRQKPNSKNERSRGGFGRRDMEFFFNFLYRKGVRYILKVIVEENGQSVHSDEAIKKALDPIIVEHLDWRKVDLDPQLIYGISSQAEDDNFGQIGLETSYRNQLRQLDLQWSGNSAVLRAWSEPEGLPSLQHLRTVNIIVPEDTIMYDSPEWILQKKNEFETRLNEYSHVCDPEQETNQSSPAPSRRKVTVNLEGVISAIKKKPGVGSLQLGTTHGITSQAVPQKVINTHEWLRCIDEFAKNINPLWTSTRASFLRSNIGAVSLGADYEATSRPTTATGLENDIVVALIDDGVSLLDQNFVGRVLEGKTFDYSDGGVGQSYNSAQGHGTEMARCILRVCPMAKIYPIRLKTQLSADRSKSEINLKSAASAINAALEKNATIISMSWTIPVLQDSTPDQEQFEAAVREAASRNVLMFCSSPDGGKFNTPLDYPSAAQRDKIFRIGAAHDHGMAFEHTGRDVDFIFPGVQVNTNATSVATGSSIATALAAGLAATIIYCHKICALALKTQTQTTPVSHDEISRGKFTESAILKLSQHAVMKGAFSRIGWVNEARFIQIWDELQPVVHVLEDPNNTDDHNMKFGIIRDLCTKLV